MSAQAELVIEWEDATRQAWDALARYKFWMFGYHAARVVYVGTLINRLGGPRLANPFADLVNVARSRYCRDCGELRRPDHRCTSDSLRWVTDGQMALLGDGALESEG